MDKIRKYAPWCIVFLLLVLCTVFITKSCHRPFLPPQTVHITDTITSIHWDTCYVKEIRVEKLRTTDTLYVYRDSIYKVVDSVNVELPISQYHTDTLMKEGDTELYLCISASGYKVSLDTISYGLSYTIPQPKKRHRVGFMVGPFIGFGYDPFTGKVCPAVGVGCSIGITLKKW